MRTFKTLVLLIGLILLINPVSCTTTKSNLSESIVPPRNSFVKIEVDDGIGSGVIIHHDKNNSFILTAGHMCIPLGKEFSALDLDGKRHELLFLKASIKPDLCLLTSKKRINKPASKIAKTSMSPGEKAFNLAAPLGIYDSNMLLQFEGYYSGQTQAILGTTVDVYTIPSRPGSSGSPVYNNKWEVVGIISMVNTQIESLALVVPLSDIQEFIKELQEQ